MQAIRVFALLSILGSGFGTEFAHARLLSGPTQFVNVPLSPSTVKFVSHPAGISRTACAYAPVKFEIDNLSAGNLTAKISASGSAKTFADDQCAVPLNTLSVPKGQQPVSVYVLDLVAEQVTVTTEIPGSSASGKLRVRHAVNVVSDSGASGTDTIDDSKAFAAAIAAAQAGPLDFPAGPPLDEKGTTAPQGIVVVPAGNYYLSRVYLQSNVRMEISANAVFRGGADPKVTCQSFLLLDTLNSATKLASDEQPIKNVTLIGVGTATDIRKVETGWDASSSFTIDDDPSHQICAWKKNNDGSYYTASVIPPAIMVRNVTGFQIENVYSVQSYGPYPEIEGHPKYYPTNVIVFQSGVGGKYDLVHGAGGTTKYTVSQQTPVSQFTHPRFGIYRNHINKNAPAGYGPAQFQSGEDLTIESLYSEGGVALRLETDVAGNALDPDFYSSPCLNYTGVGKDYRCYAWGAKLDRIHAKHIKCSHGNSAVYLVAHGQLNGSVDIADVEANNCNTGLNQSSNSTDWKISSDPHLFAGSFTPTLTGTWKIVGSKLDKSGVCSATGCLAQRPCSDADTWLMDTASKAAVSINDAALPWAIQPAGLTATRSFSGVDEACPK